jgi:hypothetical protein
MSVKNYWHTMTPTDRYDNFPDFHPMTRGACWDELTKVEQRDVYAFKNQKDVD